MKSLLTVLGMAAFFLVVSMVLPGCFIRKSQPAPDSADVGIVGRTLQELTAAPASLFLSDKFAPFFWGGFLFAIVGGVMVASGAKVRGGMTFVMGMAISGIGLLYTAFPWVVLLVFVVAGGILLFDYLKGRKAAADLEKTSTATEAIVEKVQVTPGGKDVRAALKLLPPEVAEVVTAVVEPMKQRLRQEGRLNQEAQPAAGESAAT